MVGGASKNLFRSNWTGRGATTGGGASTGGGACVAADVRRRTLSSTGGGGWTGGTNGAVRGGSSAARETTTGDGRGLGIGSGAGADMASGRLACAGLLSASTAVMRLWGGCCFKCNNSISKASRRRVSSSMRGTEEALRQARDELEIRVAERTAELQKSLAELQEKERQRLLLESEKSALSDKLETRKIVDRAKGILQRDLKITEEESYRRLQRESQQRRRSMRVIAESIVLNDQLNRRGQ